MDDVRVRAGVYCRNITISTNATASIKRVPARKVTPQTLAKRPECTLMSGMTKSPSTLVKGTTDVEAIVNLANPEKHLAQSTAARREGWVFDAAMGRKTLEITADRALHYLVNNLVDYTSPFTLVSVFKGSTSGKLQNLIGGADLIGARVQTNHCLRGRVTGTATQSVGVAVQDKWHVAIMACDGSANLFIQLVAGDEQKTSMTVEPVNTFLRFGHNQAFLGFAGKMDMAAVLNVCIYGTTAAARGLQGMTFDMLHQLYGGASPGLASGSCRCD